MRSLFRATVIIIALSISACGPQAPVNPANTALPANTATASPIPVSTDKAVSSPMAAATSKAWKEVRDESYGFGLAVPCWWLVTPITPGGIVSSMTVKNYDEAYFNSHSSKGYWEWPDGTLKLDVVVVEGADPSKSDADAYMTLVDPTVEGLVSTETQQTGTHTATILTLMNLVNPNDPNSRVFVYRLAPDKLLFINPTPQTIIDTPDFQAILASVVLSPDEQINLPTITPAPGVLDASCAQ